MNKSGLYIVTLNNIESISVNANDPRIASKCITVNYKNCKFGKAKNLSVRARNYEKVFGTKNVNFFPIVLLKDITLAERAVLAKLSKWRIRGRTGRMNEWLEGISAQELEQVIINVITEAGLSFHIIGSVSLNEILGTEYINV